MFFNLFCVCGVVFFIFISFCSFARAFCIFSQTHRLSLVNECANGIEREWKRLTASERWHSLARVCVCVWVFGVVPGCKTDSNSFRYRSDPRRKWDANNDWCVPSCRLLPSPTTTLSFMLSSNPAANTFSPAYEPGDENETKGAKPSVSRPVREIAHRARGGRRTTQFKAKMPAKRGASESDVTCFVVCAVCVCLAR